MTRGLPAGYLTALAGEYWEPVLFVQIVFSDGSAIMRLHSYVGTINWGGGTGTAQAGTSTSVTLAATASAVNGFYVGATIRITSGTGSGSSGVCTTYDGTTKIAVVASAWGTAPAAASVYAIDLPWLGVGTFGSIGVLEEGEEVSPYALTLQMSDIDTTLAPEVLNGSIKSSGITIYFGMLNGTAALIADAVVWWQGRVDSVEVAASRDAGTPSAIQLTCESRLALFDRIGGSMFSEADLQKDYTGETFFQWLPAMQERVIEWKETRGGRTGISAANSPKFFRSSGT